MVLEPMFYNYKLGEVGLVIDFIFKKFKQLEGNLSNESYEKKLPGHPVLSM